MALQKTKSIKGYDYSYWIVYSYGANKMGNCIVRLALYKDKDTRDLHIDNYELLQAKNIEGFELSISQIYTQIKASQPATQEDVDAGKIGADGEPVENVGDEMNWFADSVDV